MARAAQLPLSLGHAAALGAEDFLVAPGNQLAVDWLERWPAWPSTALAIVGPTGSGKSHLGQLWCGRAGAERVDCHTADVTFAADIAARVGAAWVDDADRIAGDQAAEALLLHLYNLLAAADGHLLLTAASPPGAWGIRLPDLSSRLNTAILVEIAQPDDSLLASVAVKLFADRQIAVGEEVIGLLVTRGERSFTWLGRAIDSIDRAALAAKRPVTTALVRTVIAELD